MTTITALPTPPSRADAANFASRADTFLSALPTFALEANTVAGEVAANAAAAAASAASAVNAPGTSATSTTSTLIVSSGDVTLTIQTGKAFVKGQWVQLASNANVLNYMIGTIKSYDSVVGTLVVTVMRSSGSGTYIDWIISLGGAVLSDLTPRNLAAGSTVKDKSGGTDRPLGFRGLPVKSITTAYTVTLDDVGFCLEVGAGGSVIFPRNSTLAAGSQFAAGDAIVIQEVGNATRSLSPATSTSMIRTDGTGATGTRTLKAYGSAVVKLAGALTDTWFIDGALT